MSKKNNGHILRQDSEFGLAMGWLVAAAVSIASWAGLS